VVSRIALGFALARIDMTLSERSNARVPPVCDAAVPKSFRAASHLARQRSPYSRSQPYVRAIVPSRWADHVNQLRRVAMDLVEHYTSRPAPPSAFQKAGAPSVRRPSAAPTGDRNLTRCPLDPSCFCVIGRMSEILNSRVIWAKPLSRIDRTARPMQLSSNVAVTPCTAPQGLR
jgi:hypothetical protein